MTVREGSVKSEKTSKSPNRTRNSSSIVGGGGSTIVTGDNYSVMSGSINRIGGAASVSGGGSYVSGTASVSETVATTGVKSTKTAGSNKSKKP